MPQEITIHLEWDGPHRFDCVGSLTGPTDFGIYQIYGGHPVYGNTALLYNCSVLVPIGPRRLNLDPTGVS